eukprot:1751466-Heterocapsa_arctica.AAC.1
MPEGDSTFEGKGRRTPAQQHWRMMNPETTKSKKQQTPARTMHNSRHHSRVECRPMICRRSPEQSQGSSCPANSSRGASSRTGRSKTGTKGAIAQPTSTATKDQAV